MNAIILSAGNSTRMYNSGAKKYKSILPILNIPNIERTILMLHMINISDIIIAVSFDNNDMDYLSEKYECQIIHLPKENKNTLTTMNYLIEYLDDTFIIEGDVVCTKNIFCKFKESTYYVMRYQYPEPDEWNVITNSNNTITNFEIGSHNSVAIFGISFWHHKDCSILKGHIQKKIREINLDDSNIFWDNYIGEILNQIQIKAYEISSNLGCEMNTFSEYQYANDLCLKIIENHAFFENVSLCTYNSNYKINHSIDKEQNLIWLNKLLEYYGEYIIIDFISDYNSWFATNEFVYMISDENNQNIAFFSIIEENSYVLLRRLYVESNFRNTGIAKKIIAYMKLYTKSLNKGLRVNVYNEKAASFYKKLGAKHLFSTYCINAITTEE